MCIASLLPLLDAVKLALLHYCEKNGDGNEWIDDSSLT